MAAASSVRAAFSRNLARTSLAETDFGAAPVVHFNALEFAVVRGRYDHPPLYLAASRRILVHDVSHFACECQIAAGSRRHSAL